MDRWHESQFRPPAADRQSGDVLIDVLGEIKTVLARYLWFRMDLYHEVLDEQGVAPSRQDQVIPLLRMVTLLDSSMTDSYDQIVWDLYKGHGELDKAMELLEEGLARNPTSYELTFRKALILHMEEQYVDCQRFASTGLAITTDTVQQCDCLRLLYWSAKETKNTELRKRALSDLRRLRPDDPLWIREEKKLQEEEGETPSDA